VAGTSFGAVSGVPIDAQLATAGFGLVWGVVVTLLAPWLARRGDRSATWSQTPLYLACALAFMSLGAALLGELLSTDPQAAFELLREPTFGMFFASTHMAFEWLLLPAVLILNWNDRPRRYVLVAAAVSFYLLRMVSAVYFAPTAMAWGELPSDTAVAGDLRAEVELWTTLNLLRGLFQELLVTALLVVAVLRPRVRDVSRSASARMFTR
jgi:hypothetical protein